MLIFENRQSFKEIYKALPVGESFSKERLSF